MKAFISTRGGTAVGLDEAIFRGMAPDGGLYVPVALPVFSAPTPAFPVGPEGIESSVQESAVTADADIRPLARWAVQSLLPSLPVATVERIVARALAFPIPLIEVEPGLHVLELFHGPTLAFKDVGARFMAALMAELDGCPDISRTVLVATSGDTGGAVASAFHDMEGYHVVVLFPRDGISERQRRQMTTLGGNVHALAVTGTFDDCQRMVKGVFADRGCAERFRLTSANSINVARLLPQALYYLHATRHLTGWPHAFGNEVRAAPRFFVPSGNLGSLCAGLIAARSGMPSAGFVAAANANRGFVDFLGGADFEPRPSVSTESSAMDVGAPSNFERLRWLFDEDDDALRRAVVGVSVRGAEGTARIRETYHRTGYVLDPHTAVAYEAARREGPNAVGPSVVLGTAHPAKFPETVAAAIGCEIPLPSALLAAQGRTEHVRPVDTTVASLITALQDIEE
jgi:threonine synthase